METWHKQTLSRPELGISSPPERADKKHTSQPSAKAKPDASKRKRERPKSMFSSRTQLFAASLLRDVKQRARKYGRKTLDFVRARAQIIVIFGALERERRWRQKVGFSQPK
jgi:hypothetical protein